MPPIIIPFASIAILLPKKPLPSGLSPIWLTPTTGVTFIIDEDFNIIYEELVPEIAQEPDYDAVIEVLKKK